MSKKIAILLLLGTALTLLVACGGPSQEYQPDEQLLTESFDDPNAWETYQSGSVDFSVNDGVYRVQTGDEGYIWGLNDQQHEDVIIEVTSTQNSAHENNAYGVMCRADISNNGDGYYFLISGDGYYTISKGEGDNVNQLVEWTSSSTINTGQASNTIRAVCAGNYLALYVNDKFLAETTDSDYKSGFAGFAATAFEGGDTDVSFDNLTISTASASGG
ncbi:MAG: hypothetical protein H6654_15785 [Ardenticatenaceae bacterium]|nr:hypothetical protein [Anaerolineales bacterium]MCB8939558.1 hypothetical protein [Ardenticatenaceae bacterium]MCB8975019.1 hypothetical protein [Ardenticatenaceae bacterium]